MSEIIGLAAAIAFAVYFSYKRRETLKKNRVLAREIAEAIEYKESLESITGDTVIPVNTEVPDDAITPDSPDASLFQQLRDAILRDQLYLDPSLDRQTLVDRFGLSKERIGAAFAKGSPYKSLIEFLTDCRLPHAAKLLTSRPDLSIADVARESGFPSADTFGRNFKQKYALTPSAYRSASQQL